MKKISFVMAALALFLFAGCAVPVDAPEADSGKQAGTGGATVVTAFRCEDGRLVDDVFECNAQSNGSGSQEGGTGTGGTGSSGTGGVTVVDCTPNTIKGCNSTHYCADNKTCVRMEVVSVAIYGEDGRTYPYYPNGVYHGTFNVTVSGSEHPATLRIVVPSGSRAEPSELQAYPDRQYQINYTIVVPANLGIGVTEMSVLVYQTVPGGRVAKYRIYVERDQYQ